MSSSGSAFPSLGLHTLEAFYGTQLNLNSIHQAIVVFPKFCKRSPIIIVIVVAAISYGGRWVWGTIAQGSRNTTIPGVFFEATVLVAARDPSQPRVVTLFRNIAPGSTSSQVRELAFPDS